MAEKAILSEAAQTVLAYVDKAGTAGIALMMVAFYLGQQAGWVPNVDRMDHTALMRETQQQNLLLQSNQELLKEIVRQARGNQIAFVQLARGICISVTKTSEIERRCLVTE